MTFPKLNLTESLLFGVETEYAIFMFDESGNALSQDAVEDFVSRALHKTLCATSLPFMESHGGFAIDNGGRAYWDRLGPISSAEYSTPECRSPLETCAHVMAGHRFYKALADQIERSGQAATIEVHLPGTSLSNGTSNGLHLNLFRWVNRPATELIPHLVSLPCLTGSGGWATDETPSLNFVRSPRANLISVLHGSDSSNVRPLIDTYDKPAGFGRRVQEMAGDATHSPLPLYVRLGSCGLLLALIDHWGLSINHLVPEEPIMALKVWNRSPLHKVKIDGKLQTALDLQGRLLDLVRASLERPLGEIPAWASEVTEFWQRLLDAASNESDEDRITLLDWAFHEAILKEITNGCGVSWGRLGIMSAAYERLGKLQGTGRPVVNRVELLRSVDGMEQIELIESQLSQDGICWADFETTSELLMPMLHLASTELSEVGSSAHVSFEQAMRRHLPRLTEEMIVRAAHHPPADTRAKIRADFVKSNAGKVGAAAGWETLQKCNGERIELPDPFECHVSM